MGLECFEIIKVAFLFEKHGKFVFIVISSPEVLLAAAESVVKAFQSNCKHFDEVIELEDSTQCLDHTLVYELQELLGACGSRAVTESPYCLVFDLNVVMLKDRDKFVDDAHIDTKLYLLLGSSCDV